MHDSLGNDKYYGHFTFLRACTSGLYVKCSMGVPPEAECRVTTYCVLLYNALGGLPSIDLLAHKTHEVFTIDDICHMVVSSFLNFLALVNW
jgi:hypothetical protein